MNGHSGLYLRGSNYYFRGKIPAYLHYLAPTKYILHSLKTKSIGQSIYCKRINIAFLNRELNKIEYTCLKSILENFSYDPNLKDYSTCHYELSKGMK